MDLAEAARGEGNRKQGAQSEDGGGCRWRVLSRERLATGRGSGCLGHPLC